MNPHQLVVAFIRSTSHLNAMLAIKPLQKEKKKTRRSLETASKLSAGSLLAFARGLSAKFGGNLFI